MEKYCEKCGVKFTPQTSRNEKRQKYCSKRCQTSVAQKTFYDKNPDKVFSTRKKSNENWPRKTLWCLKARAKKYGLPFNLDESDVELVESCPVLGIKLERTFGNKGSIGYRPNAPSVDRIIPEKGYTKGNVRVISARANLLKNNAEIWELEKVLEDLKCHIKL